MIQFLMACCILLGLCSSAWSEPQKPLRFFVLDYHSSATADIINIFEELGHEVVCWTISPYSQRIFGRDNDLVEIINLDNWQSINKEMCDQFSTKYEDFLNQFDGFLVTAFSSYSLLYEKFEKPIIIVNAARYEIPFTDKPYLWDRLNTFLIDGVSRNKIFLVANNKGDVAYLKKYTGLDSDYIPSLCDYTKAEYSGKNKAFVLHNPRENAFIRNVEDELSRLGLVQSHPKNFKSWQTLYDYQGIIHIPYQISIMSLFEQYTANVPLFFPSKTFLFHLQKQKPNDVLSEVSFFSLFNSIPPPKTPGDLNNMSDPNVVKFWIDSADYYDEDNMPYIQYFNSFDHLKKLLRNTDTQLISRKMKEHNLKRKEMVLNKWRGVLDKVSQGLPGGH